MNVSVLHTKREGIEQDREKIELKLKVEVNKRDYLNDLDLFYSKREDVTEDLASFSIGWEDKQKDLENIELTFFKELKNTLIQKIFFDRVDHSFSTEQKNGKLTARFGNSKFNGLINIDLKMPEILQVKRLFGTREEKITLPDITYLYFLSGEGKESMVERIIENYGDAIALPPLKQTFSEGERVIITNSLKKRNSKEINFKLNTRLEILPEYYLKKNKLDAKLSKKAIFRIEKDLFADRRSGLLYKLFHDPKLGHKVIKESDNAIRIEIRNQDSSLQAEFYSTIEKIKSCLITFVYDISGKVNVEKEEEMYSLLKEYWPSTEE